MLERTETKFALQDTWLSKNHHQFRSHHRRFRVASSKVLIPSMGGCWLSDVCLSAKCLNSQPICILKKMHVASCYIMLLYLEGWLVPPYKPLPSVAASASCSKRNPKSRGRKATVQNGALACQAAAVFSVAWQMWVFCRPCLICEDLQIKSCFFQSNKNRTKTAWSFPCFFCCNVVKP